MSNEAVNQLMMLGAEAITIALLVLFLFRIRSRFGLSPLYVSLGVFQPIQVLLASSIYVEILPGMVVSPGSIIMFTASLLAVLLVYIREDAIEARKVIYGIIVANLTMTLLLLIFSVQLGLPGTLNVLSLPREIFNQGARVMVTGTLVLFCDVILVIFIYEAMSRFFTRSPFLRIYATMAIVLIFDTTAFATGAFFGQPLFRSILIAGIIGKVVMAAFYAGALTIYLRFFDPVDKVSPADQSFHDIFYALTYREKYKIERHRGEEAQKRGKREWDVTFDAMSDWVTLIDLEGKILRINRAGEQFLGMPPSKLTGRICCELFHGPEWPIPECPLQKALLTRQRESTELHMPDKDQWVMITVDPVFDEDGKMIYAVHIVSDITERKEAEEELRKYREQLEELVTERTHQMQEKTTELEEANIKLQELDHLKSMFIASMSHELRTPLNSIIGFTGIILQGMTGEINPEQRDQLQRVYGSGKHLLALINDVIDISKIEAGKVKIYTKQFDLDGIVKEAISNLKTEIDNKGLDLAITLSQDVKLTTDRKRLLQCILNFLSNAVKFTKKGKITVTAHELDGTIEIAVKDTGIGMKEEDVPRLFESFVRLDSELKIGTPGTGLGLYLTKKIVTEQLKGSVSVESTYGEGSTFVLRIPKEI